MNEGKIVVRYAKAIFELAKEKKILDQVSNDMELLFYAGRNVSEFRFLIENPVMKSSEKIALIKKIFGSQFSEITFSFLELVGKNKRFEFLADIARIFLDIYRKEKGIKTATLTTVYAIDDATRKSIQEVMKKYNNGKEIVLDEHINKKLIGGFIINIDDMRFDASVSNRLATIKRKLLNTLVKS